MNIRDEAGRYTDEALKRIDGFADNKFSGMQLTAIRSELITLFSAGYTLGHAEGLGECQGDYDKGFFDGREEGHSDGYNEGWSEGYDSGYSEADSYNDE